MGKYCKCKNTYTFDCDCENSELWKQGIGVLSGQGGSTVTNSITPETNVRYWISEDNCLGTDLNNEGTKQIVDGYVLGAVTYELTSPAEKGFRLPEDYSNELLTLTGSGFFQSVVPCVDTNEFFEMYISKDNSVFDFTVGSWQGQVNANTGIFAESGTNVWTNIGGTGTITDAGDFWRLVVQSGGKNFEGDVVRFFKYGTGSVSVSLINIY